jgi:methylenetetrahydrofolate dehydrogenase (NADP+) / methenyltetrahydrofolate cyclohydrolase
MSAILIDGKNAAKEIRRQIKAETSQLLADTGIRPGLAVVLVGDDSASHIYVNSKEKDCSLVGFHSEVHRLAEDTSMDELLGLIEKLNHDDKIHGILVQLPIPKHLDEAAVIKNIDPKKDVDGFNLINVGLLVTGGNSFVPCTPKAIIWLLKNAGVEIKGKHAVVVGRSNIVGKPAASLLLNEHATVTICHSRTIDLASITRQADILVAAIGKPEFITGDMIKPGAAVIDVGINRRDDGMVGDVDFASASEVAGYITPVPGGVGPMTRAMLLQNTLEAAKRNG